MFRLILFYYKKLSENNLHKTLGHNSNFYWDQGVN